ncbi:MAG: TetR family transcriptional regulator [Myxococcales bacterium]|nr:TetR family transcriptional regulator [Myxococcales bacterium]MCB9752108.1 TetR family transcriptional regulator [Myxococcales bacterium]
MFAEHGFEATTMEGIAAVAKTSIGSVYQFFPNKRAVFRAVAERCIERSAEVFTELFSSPGAQGEGDEPQWSRMIDDAVDAFARLHAREPSFTAVITNVQLYEDYADADEAMIRTFVAVIEGLLGQWAPALPQAKRHVVALMLVQTTALTLVASSREAPEIAQQMMLELRVMLRRYVAPYVRAEA